MAAPILFRGPAPTGGGRTRARAPGRRRRCPASARHPRAAVLLVLGLIAAAAGCSTGSAPGTGPAPVVLRVGVAQPRGSDSPQAAVRQVADLLTFAPLLVAVRDGTVQPGLAESWSLSDDGRVLRLKLRSNLAFQDGTPLDAEAAAAALRADLATPSPLPGLRDVSAIRVASPTDVIVEQRAPSSLLLEDIALRSVYGGRDGSSTAGPFRIVSGEGDLVVLEAFDGYFRGRPGIDRVEVRGYPSSRSAWVALMRDEVDLLYEVPSDALEFVESSREIRTFSFLRAFTYVFGFNLAHPALRDVRARRALGLALDRKAIIQQAFGGRAVAATGALSLRHWAYDASQQPPRHAPADARALLEEAGLARGGAARGGAPLRLRLSCLLPDGYGSFERVALVLQRQLLEIGVDLEPEVGPVPELLQRLATGRFETYLFEQVAGWGLSWTYAFWHSPGDGPTLLRSGYRGADAALERVRRAWQPAELRAAVRDLQRVLAEDPPAVFLAWSERSRAVRRRFVLPDEEGRDAFTMLPQWRLASGESGR